MIVDSPQLFPEPLHMPKTGSSQGFSKLTPRAPSGAPSKAAPRRRLRHRSEAPSREEDKAITVVPIWLGSPMRDVIEPVRSLKQIIPEDMHQHETVVAIEGLESDVPLCVSDGLFVEAAESLEQAISLRREFLGDGHPDFITSIESYVVACNVWGVQSLNAGLSTVALELLKKAEAMTEADNVPNFKRRVALRAATFNNLCCYFRSRNKANAALQFAEKALKIEQRYKEAQNQARTQLNYAVLLSTTGRSEEALAHIEAAVALLHDQERQLMHDQAQQSDSLEELRQETCSELVVAHYNMFVENLRLNRRPASLECLHHAVNVARHKLSESHPLTEKMQQAYKEAKDRLFKAQRTLPKMAATDGFRESATMRFQEGDPHPWQKADIGQADSHAAQEILCDNRQITLRKRRPSPRPPPPAEMKTPRRGMTHMKKHDQLFGFVPAIVNEVSGPWLSSHPKLQTTEGFVGSPILTQQAHGVQPMSARASQGTSPRWQKSHRGAPHSARARMDSGGSGQPAVEVPLGATSTTSSWPPIPTTPGRPPSNPRPLPLSGPESPHLAIAYEYHRRQLQMRESATDGQAEMMLEPDRLRAITVLRGRLNQRREKGLPLPSDANRSRAVTKIQARVRGYQARQWSKEELAKELRRQRLQASGETTGGDMKRRVAFRVIYAARQGLQEYGAAVKIQKLVRGAVTRLKIRRQIAMLASSAASRLQTMLLRWLARCQRKKLDSAAAKIQARLRGIVVRGSHEQLRQVAVKLSSGIHGKAVRLKMQRQRQAAIEIQRIAKGKLARAVWRRQKAALVHIQRIARGKAARRLAERQRYSACQIAALWRGYYMRKQAELTIETVVRIQTFWRLRTDYRKYQQTLWAVKVIQGIRRTLHVKTRVRKMKATSSLIQKASARFLEVTAERQAEVASTKIQRIHRGKQQRKTALNEKASAALVQAHFRGRQVRSHLARMNKVAAEIQAAMRGNICRRRYRKTIQSAVRIQALLRGVRVRMQHQRLLKAVLRISSYRRFLAVKRTLGAPLIKNAFQQTAPSPVADSPVAASPVAASPVAASTVAATPVADNRGKELDLSMVVHDANDHTEEQFRFDYSPKTAISSQYAELESTEDPFASEIAGAILANTEFTYSAGELMTESEVLAADGAVSGGPPLPHGGDGSYDDEELEANAAAAAAVAGILEIRCTSSMRTTPLEVEMEDGAASEVLDVDEVSVEAASVFSLTDLDVTHAPIGGKRQGSVADDVGGTSTFEGLPANEIDLAGQIAVDDAIKEIGANIAGDQALSPDVQAGAHDSVRETPEDLDVALDVTMFRVKKEIEDLVGSERNSPSVNTPMVTCDSVSVTSAETRAVIDRVLEPIERPKSAPDGNEVLRPDSSDTTESRRSSVTQDGRPRRHSWYSQARFGPI